MAGGGGIVVWRGRSTLDGAPIVAIVTFGSHNEKTGAMSQAWILRADIDPLAAIASGRDRSICGACVHRSGSAEGRSCYVVPWFAPLNVWKHYSVGGYPSVEPEQGARLLAGQNLRISAYGDPAVVPFRLWRRLLVRAAGWTGYTHQWRTCDQRFRELCMASVESTTEAAAARRLGWRTFRTRTNREGVEDETEIVCPASAEAGRRLTCEECRLCVGTARPTARGIVILAHGQRTGNFLDTKRRAEQ